MGADHNLAGTPSSTMMSIMTMKIGDYQMASKIFHGATTHWEGMYEEGEGGILQKHTIPHLKIYRLPDDTLVADYGRGSLDAGSYKRAKEAVRVGETGVVRLTRLKEEEQKLRQKIGAAPDDATKAKLKKELEEMVLEESAEFSRVNRKRIAYTKFVSFHQRRGAARNRGAENAENF